MSFILRDPFFDGFDDIMTTSWPFSSTRSPLTVEDESHSTLSAPKRMRRDIITPLSGFGRMDMQETPKSYELNVDIPGMEKNEIQITTENNALIIKGERKQEKSENDKDKKYHFMERHFGSFRREMSLPSNANSDNIIASYDNGVLKVSIPKIEMIPDKKDIMIK